MHIFNNAQTQRCSAWRHDPYSLDGPVFEWVPTPHPSTETLAVPITATRFAVRHPEAEPIRRQTPPPAARPPVQPAPPVPCKRKYCMVGMPLHEQLVRLLDGKTPRHNRGKPKISDAPKFRTAICKHTKNGHCCCDAVCWMAHSKAERRTRDMNIADGIDKASAVDVFIAHSIRVHLGDVGT